MHLFRVLALLYVRAGTHILGRSSIGRTYPLEVLRALIRSTVKKSIA